MFTPNFINLLLIISLNLKTTYSYLNKPAYPFKDIENKWQKYWLQNETFKTTSAVNTDTDLKPKYYCLGMIPYPSNTGLHLGHMLGYTGLDIVSRYKRMCGFNVLNPIGWDSFGLPAERYAEEVNRPVQEVVDENIANFKRQLLLMGYSYDWSREIRTSDPNYYKWTQWTFLEMYKKGLVARRSCLVNYCPKLETVLSNEEIINGLSERGSYDIYRKKIPHWIIKITNYSDWLHSNLSELADWPAKVINAQRNWIGKQNGFLASFSVISDGKSPDTKLNAFVKNPNDLLNCDRIDICADFEGIEDLITPEQSNKVEDFTSKCKKLSNIERLKLFEIVPTGSYVKNPINGERIPIFINPNILSDISSDDTANCRIHVTKPNNEADHDSGKIFTEHTRFSMRDWIFSRQRSWGEPIPLLYNNDKYTPADDLPYTTSDKKESMPQWAGSSFHFVRFIDPANNDSLISKDLAKKWLPVDLYVGGSEHSISHLLYSRFWYKFLYDIGQVPNPVPFKKVCLHGMLHIQDYTQLVDGLPQKVPDEKVVHYKGNYYVKDSLGNPDLTSVVTAKSYKMSKSKGNAVSPDTIIEQYGSDVLRMHLMFLGPFDQDKIWKLEGISGMERMLTRIYRLVVKNGRFNRKIVDIPLNPTYKREVNFLIEGVTKDIETLRFNKSPALFSTFLNFISGYTRGVIRENLEPHDFSVIPLECIKILIKLLNPFCPHLAEELWEIIRNNESKSNSSRSLSYESWPKPL